MSTREQVGAAERTRPQDKRAPGWSFRAVGFSLVELLIVVAIVGILLAIVGGFFAQQSRLARDSQVRNAVNVASRTVAEALTQDLILAGSRAIVDAAGTSAYVGGVEAVCQPVGATARDRCVTVTSEASSVRYTIAYVSSLRLPAGTTAGSPAGQEAACRRVDYVLAQDRRLYRSDLTCASSAPTTTAIMTFGNLFAEGVEILNIGFVCESDAAPEPNPQSCYVGDGFVRAAQVNVRVVSERVNGLRSETSLSAFTPNLRPPVQFD